MSRPGVEVYSLAAAPPSGVPTDTSVAFIVAEAAQGPTDAPTRLTSLDAFDSTYGSTRIPGTYGRDSVEIAFSEGVSTIYFMRAADGALAATADAAAIAAGSTVDAASPGAWADGVKLDVAGSVGAKSVTVTSAAGAVVQKSGAVLVTLGDLQGFLASGTTLVASGGDPTTPLTSGTVTLAGGDDGTLPASDTAVITAINGISKTLGPGNLGAPGRFAVDVQTALLAAAEATNRYAVLDTDPAADAVELLSATLELRGLDSDRYGMLWAPWAVVSGVAPGTKRTIPWSPIQMGACARVDKTGNPNQAAAGQWGVSNSAIGLTQAFSDDEAEQLLYAGVDTARTVYGAVEAYGFRSLVDPNGPRRDWLQANWGRLNMAIVAQSERVGQSKVFAQLDGRGHTIAAYNGALAGVLLDFYNRDALFGDTAVDAFEVNTGPQVNTIENIADGILSAVLDVCMSPHAELVRIYIVKSPIAVALAA